jgi:hypothetical protein
VARAYDMFRAYEGIEREKNKNKELKNKTVIQNKIQDFKTTFFF